jgi:DNA-directed RNA polymerase sigma subunit (sigma70/sigma32)
MKHQGVRQATASGERTWEGMAVIEENLRRLSGREEQVLRLLFGIGEVAHSRDELSRRLAISRDWLRQIELRALSNLRSMATEAIVARRRRPALRRERAPQATYRDARSVTAWNK